jgi:hypothetical protein
MKERSIQTVGSFGPRKGKMSPAAGDLAEEGLAANVLRGNVPGYL